MAVRAQLAEHPVGALVVVDPDVEIWSVARGERLCTLAGEGVRDAVRRLSRDGRRLAVATPAGELKIWDVDAPAVLRVFALPAGSWGPATLTSPDRRPLALSADGGRVAVALADHRIGVWDVASGEVLCVASGHQAPITALAMSALGNRLASCAEDRTRRVWDAMTGSELHQARTPPPAWDSGPFSSSREWVELSGDGALVVVHDQASLAVHRVESSFLRLHCDLGGHAGQVLHAQLSLDGRWAVSASADRTLRVWDTQAAPAAAPPHGTDVTRLLFYQGGRRCFSSGYQSPRWWDTASGAAAEPPGAALPREELLALSDDGMLALAAGAVGDRDAPRVVDLATGRTVAMLAGHTRAVGAVALSRDGGRAITASWDDTVRIWDRGRAWECTHSFRHSGRKWVAMSRDGGRVATLEGPPGGDVSAASLVVRDVDSEAVLAALPMRSWQGGQDGAWLNPDGTQVLVDTARDRQPAPLDVATGLQVAQLPRPPAGERAHRQLFSFSDDGRWLLMACGPELSLWSLPGLRRTGALQLDAVVTVCGISADGSHLLAGDHTGRVHFLRIA